MIPTSILTLIISKSGRGKSTAIRNCDPLDTFIINVMGKMLPFINACKWVEKENKYTDASAMGVITMMNKVSKDEKWQNLIIDDGQYIMASEFVAKANVKGFEKWNVLAKQIWDILTLANRLRAGLKVFFLCHEDTTDSERKMKTLGKLLEDKLCPEGLATIVLYADVIAKGGTTKYIFTTQSDGVTNAKSPMGMFPKEIPNDLRLVSDRINEYYNGITLEDSKLDFTIT